MASPGRAQTSRTDRIAARHRALSEYLILRTEDIDRRLDAWLNKRTPEEDVDMSRAVRGYTYARLSPIVQFSESETLEGKVRFALRADLWRTRHRLQILADNFDDERDVLSPFSASRIEERIESEDTESARLRVLLAELREISFDADAGLRFSPEPEPRGQLRARWDHAWGDWRLRLTQSLLWREDPGFGERTEIDVDWLGRPHWFFRSSTVALWAEETRGVELGQTLSAHRDLGRLRTVGVKLGVAGYTHPVTRAELYLVRFPYRQRLYRNWIYGQLEPGADFHRERDFGFDPLIIFRVDFFFGDPRGY